MDVPRHSRAVGDHVQTRGARSMDVPRGAGRSMDAPPFAPPPPQLPLPQLPAQAPASVGVMGVGVGVGVGAKAGAGVGAKADAMGMGAKANAMGTTGMDAATLLAPGDYGRRKEREWSGEWNVRDMDAVARRLRGLKGR